MSTEKNQKNAGLDLLEVKKSPKVDLESQRSVWVLIGLVISLAAFFAFIEWTAFEDKDKPLAVKTKKDVEEPIIMIEIPVTLPEKKVVPPPPEAKEIVDIIELVDEEISDDYAKLAKMSKFHFLRVFKEITGVSPVEYKNKVRIEHAKELLEDTNLGIGEIGISLGFSSSSYFCDAFKNKVGISPTQYRKILNTEK